MLSFEELVLKDDRHQYGTGTRGSRGTLYALKAGRPIASRIAIRTARENYAVVFVPGFFDGVLERAGDDA